MITPINFSNNIKKICYKFNIVNIAAHNKTDYTTVLENCKEKNENLSKKYAKRVEKKRRLNYNAEVRRLIMECIKDKFFDIRNKIDKITVIRAVLTVLIIINCIVIFNFSSEPSEKSNKTSGKVVDTIVENCPQTKNLDGKEKEKKKEEMVVPVRKTAHFSVYMCLGTLIYLFVRTFKGKNVKKILISIGLAFLYACSDEVHQTFVDGRSGEFRDVLIDTCGAGFGVLAVCLVCEIWWKIRKRKNK